MQNEELTDFVHDVAISAILILDSRGERIYTNYYPDYNHQHEIYANVKQKEAVLAATTPTNATITTNNNNTTTDPTPSVSAQNSNTDPDAPVQTKPRQKKIKPPTRFQNRRALAPTPQQQQQLEQSLIQRARVARNGASPLYGVDMFDVVSFENFVLVYCQVQDIVVAVVISDEENEMVAQAVLQTLTAVLNQLFQSHLNKEELLRGIDFVFLVVDEMLDDGYVLEMDAETILYRVSFRDGGEPAGDQGGVDLQPGGVGAHHRQGDVTLTDALGIAGNAFFKAFMKQ